MSTLRRMTFLLAAIVLVALPLSAQQQADPYSVTVTPEMARHSRILDTLYFAGFAYGILELLIILGTRISARLRDISERVTKRPYFVAILYVLLFSIVTAIFDFPLSYYSGFVVPHQFNLTDQSFAGWLGDEGKALALGTFISILIVPLALLAIRRMRRWWLALWLGSIPLMILGIVIAPIVIDPIFNKFEPLRDQVLKQKLLDEASRAGIEGSRVYQVDKSKQTKTMNAYVTGIGGTKRIVLWDTLLAKMTEDEVVAVIGHEIGHYVLNHMWEGLGFGIVISLLVVLVGQTFYERGLVRWGEAWRARTPGDPATLPWLLLIVSLMSFILSPVINGMTRHMEHQADIFSLEFTHLNDALARSFVKFAVDSKVDPTPNRFIEFWRYSHPSLSRRIEFVRSYKPWEEGKPNQVWKGGR